MKIAPLMLALLLAPAFCMAEEDSQPARPGEESVAQQDEVLNDLAFYALSLAGTPYRYGGNAPETGFDCSGFVGHVFRETLGLELPRSSREMEKLGERIEQDQLRPGDLVFYNTLRRKFSHVGIYLGDGRFVHSPSSNGSIRVDDMRGNYWRKRFDGARRIISSSR